MEFVWRQIYEGSISIKSLGPAVFRILIQKCCSRSVKRVCVEKNCTRIIRHDSPIVFIKEYFLVWSKVAEGH